MERKFIAGCIGAINTNNFNVFSCAGRLGDLSVKSYLRGIVIGVPSMISMVWLSPCLLLCRRTRLDFKSLLSDKGIL